MKSLRRSIAAMLLLGAGLGLWRPALNADDANPWGDIRRGKTVQGPDLSPGTVSLPIGVAVTIGFDDASRAVELSRSGASIAQALSASDAVVDRMREEIRDARLASRVSADLLPEDGRLPYAENMVNRLLLADAEMIAPKEIERVLTPNGMAILEIKDANAIDGIRENLLSAGFSDEDLAIMPNGEAVFIKKPWPADIDNWSHYRHAADGNPVANDMVVAPPKHLQWKAGPVTLRSHETDSSFSAAVIAGGRFFSIVDEATVSTPGQEGLPDKWSLIARDAFNGVELWRIPIAEWGWRMWKDTWFTCRPGDMPLNLEMRLVASEDGDRLYATLGYHAAVSEIDGRTGEVLRTFDGTEETREILLAGDSLVLTIAASPERGAGARVALVDLKSGAMKWRTDEVFGGTASDYIKWKAMNGQVQEQTLDPALNIAADGKTIALIDRDRIVGLNQVTGEERWSVSLADEENPALWLGALILADNHVLYSDRTRLFALSADDGRQLWRQDKKYLGHLWYEWKDVFVIDGVVWTWSPEIEKNPGGLVMSPATVTGYDLATGERVRDVPLGGVMKAVHHHRCYPNRATPRFILSSRRGTEYLDLEEGAHSVNNWVRGTCHFGMLPAHGLQYAPPHPCRCFYLEKINGLNALAPASVKHEQPPFEGERLTRGPAYGQPIEKTASADDWPTFRATANRFSATIAQLPETLAEAWATKLGPALSAPTIAAGRVFAALVDENQVIALDAATGRELWRYHIGAPIDSPPTYAEGVVYFGGGDGAVYALRASDGELVWRFFAADVDRRIHVFGRLESASPVHGSVLVVDGKVYFAVGRSSHLDGGLKLYALDAKTGEVVHHRRIEGPDYNVANIEANDQRVLPEGALADVMSSDGRSIFMRGYRFDLDLSNQKVDDQAIAAKGGMLDGTYFRRLHWNFGNATRYAQQLVVDADNVHLARMFEKMIFLSPDGGYSPGVDGFQLLTLDREQFRPRWSTTIPVRVRAMCSAGDRLLVAGPPEVMPQDDPHAAYEGRLGGRLLVFDATTGVQLSERGLPSPPVLGGIAVAEGRVVLTLENGQTVCLGEK